MSQPLPQALVWTGPDISVIDPAQGLATLVIGALGVNSLLVGSSSGGYLDLLAYDVSSNVPTLIARVDGVVPDNPDIGVNDRGIVALMTLTTVYVPHLASSTLTAPSWSHGVGLAAEIRVSGDSTEVVITDSSGGLNGFALDGTPTWSYAATGLNTLVIPRAGRAICCDTPGGVPTTIYLIGPGGVLDTIPYPSVPPGYVLPPSRPNWLVSNGLAAYVSGSE